MATNFFARWSKRKLDGAEQQQVDEDNSISQELSAQEVENQPLDTQVSESATPSIEKSNTTEASDPLGEGDNARLNCEETTGADPLSTEEAETQDPEKMSLASLLVSQVEESAKKAAMRKLFMSEEFNIRDGLDDYDDDYSNLKALSQGVAETLREWVKEKPEETTEPNSETLSDIEPEINAEQSHAVSDDASQQAEPLADQDVAHTEGEPATDSRDEPDDIEHEVASTQNINVK